MARHADWCDCPGCVEFRAVHARLCRELTRAEREANRARARDAQWRYEAAHPMQRVA